MHYAERPLPIGTRGNVVIVALVVTMVAGVLAAVFEVLHYGILADLNRGEDLSFETVDGSDTRVLAMDVLKSLCQLGAGIATCAWLFRAYGNLRRLGVWQLRYDPAWAVGAWFIPLFNLVRPKQIVNDVWRGSVPEPGPKRLEDHPRVAPVVHVWWAAWVLVSVVTVADLVVYEWSYTLPAQMDATIVSIAADAVFVAAAAIMIVAVRKVTKRQTKAIERALAAGPPVPPPPPAPYGWGMPPSPAPEAPWSGPRP
jgi:hypothetical protein